MDTGQVGPWMSDPAVRFVENRGQWTNDDGEPVNDVLYYADLPGTRVCITTHGLTYFFHHAVEVNGEATRSVQWERVDMLLDGDPSIPTR